MAGWEKKPCPWCDAPPGCLHVVAVPAQQPPQFPAGMKFGDRRNSLLGTEPLLWCKVCFNNEVGEYDGAGHVLFDMAAIIKQRQESSEEVS